MHYHAILRTAGDETFAEFPDVPGCVARAGAGEDIEEAAGGALLRTLERALTRGEPLPTPCATEEPEDGDDRLRVVVPVALAVRLTLRSARLGAGLSQSELARRVGVSRQAYHQFEQAGSSLRVSTLERIAAALGCELDVALRLRPAAVASR